MNKIMHRFLNLFNCKNSICRVSHSDNLDLKDRILPEKNNAECRKKLSIDQIRHEHLRPMSLTCEEGKPDCIEVNGILFELECSGDSFIKTSEERVILCKPVVMLEYYLNTLPYISHKKILELGIFQGGSSLFLTSVFKNIKKLVAIDLAAKNDILQAIIKKNGCQDILSLHFDTPQDSSDVKKYVEQELGGQPDIVIDDCSHLYGPSKRSFEMIFPMLAPGGLYIIEDWSWSHDDPFQGNDALWHDEPALTNFIFELIMLQGSRPHFFESITIESNSAMVVIKKSMFPIDTPFCIDSLIVTRGKKLNLI